MSIPLSADPKMGHVVTYNDNETFSPEAALEHTIALMEIFPPLTDI